MNAVRPTATSATGPAPRPVTPAGLLAGRLAALVARLDERDRSDLARELRDLGLLAGGLEDYLESQTTAESPARRRLAERTATHDWITGHRTAGLEQEMLSGNVEAQTLAMLVRATGARRVLEIGTFSGYAALAMAEALSPGGVVVTCERDDATAAFAQAAFDDSPDGSKIDLRVGPATDTLTALARAGDAFDLVFVDADKAGYRDYVDVLLRTGLLADRGLLCIDNTLMQGEPWTGTVTANGMAIAEFNEWLAADPRVIQVVVPLRDGLTLVCRSATGMRGTRP